MSAIYGHGSLAPSRLWRCLCGSQGFEKVKISANFTRGFVSARSDRIGTKTPNPKPSLEASRPCEVRSNRNKKPKPYTLTRGFATLRGPIYQHQTKIECTMLVWVTPLALGSITMYSKQKVYKQVVANSLHPPEESTPESTSCLEAADSSHVPVSQCSTPSATD